uniref:Tethering factor for nuclear proteasome STS1 n=1 Tax=Mycena chlorophos TaxID=658473 RepID=A0ABQ0KZR6_MYCCL|nr:predicted protein [Mycena chlorophos]
MPTTFASFGQPPPPRLKRRLEDDDATLPDTAMDRSPTPERPKRAPPKRARVALETVKDDAKENKAPTPAEDNQVDVGMLLASLPSQSLLPILTSLISQQPSLKHVVLSLIPRPTLDTALQAVAQSVRKLRDAYPYSSTSPNPNVPPTFGFGSPRSSFATPRTPQQPQMRDSYVISRLRPHTADFAAACMSYLPYFSYIAPPSGTAPMHKGQLHPSETYLLLAAITDHILSLPPLVQTQLVPQLLSRLAEEWRAWLDKVDSVLKEGGMFTADVLESWIRGLDSYAAASGEFGDMMRPVRDGWIERVGWTVGRQPCMDI